MSGFLSKEGDTRRRRNTRIPRLFHSSYCTLRKRNSHRKIPVDDIWNLAELEGVVMVERYGEVVFYGDVQTPAVKARASVERTRKCVDAEREWKRPSISPLQIPA